MSYEVAPSLRLTTGGGTEIDVSGMSELSMRLQLGAADELSLTLPAQTLDGAWRSDMPIWQQGALIAVEAGYDGELTMIQEFEIVSTTVSYPEGESGEELTVRGVSDLARAARNKNPRAYASGSDADVVSALCTEYGWGNLVTAPLAEPDERLKEAGKSDLELLNKIARAARIGGPRLLYGRELIMPEPVVGPLKFSRGLPRGTGEYRRLHSLSMNRDGGPNPIRVAVLSWDPKTNQFVQIEFQADEFGGDPKIVYEGPASTKELTRDATTQGLTLAVIQRRGQGDRERTDILTSGQFMNETDARSLAQRWFELREKMSRWATVTVDGHPDLVPYTSIELDGNLAAMDRGTWLPTSVRHRFSSSGWLTECKVIRVVNDPVVSPSQ